MKESLNEIGGVPSKSLAGQKNHSEALRLRNTINSL